jgi:hypothetical protein
MRLDTHPSIVQHDVHKGRLVLVLALVFYFLFSWVMR